MVAWDGVEERFHKSLAMWKKLYISKGGRITLIQSTLSCLPIYFMSLLCIPRSDRLRLEQTHKDFLWGGGGRVETTSSKMGDYLLRQKERRIGCEASLYTQ